MRDTYIFDIDGTLANVDHRRHYVRTKPKNWKAFNAAMKDDTPNAPVVAMLRAMRDAGFAIVLSSGRSMDNYRDTVDWLDRHDIKYDALYMRGSGDYRSDVDVKQDMLHQIRFDGYHPVGVVDDRPCVVQMWRSNGLFVFDVNQSGVDF